VEHERMNSRVGGRIKQIFFLLLFIFTAACSWAGEDKIPVHEISGVVKSVTPGEVRVSYKYFKSNYHLYVFRITDKTKIIGRVEKGAFVRVKFFQRNVYASIASEIKVLNAPNAYYQRMY
jgi:hypothetical protein